MNREEAIKHLETYSTTNGSGQTTQAQHEEAKQMAIKALEQQPCEDAISREHTLAEFKRWYFDDKTVIRCAELVLKNEPPVTPQPKTGYWIGIDGKPSHLQDGMTTGSVWCLECGKWLTASDEYSCFGKFCPNCGARMIEPQERSDKECR